jgi:imidazolonepropionase-like amidohydrolase
MTHTLINNVRVFDGVTDGLSEPMNVRVTGNLIDAVSAEPLDADGCDVIDGGGRTVMPGLIDAHMHYDINMNFAELAARADRSDLAIRSVEVARRTLMDGFTSTRDTGGSPFGLKRAIDCGDVDGPRIYPSGPMISQTSGHGDFGCNCRPNPHLTGNHTLDAWEVLGLAHIVDGRDQVLAAVRQNLRQGASQIKIMGGGGGSSPWDPIDTTQFTTDEWSAAVEAAEDWGTYVCTHIFTPRAVNRALDAGVKSLEHAFFLDRETVERIAEEGAFVVPQAWGMSPEVLKNPNLDPTKVEPVRQLQAAYSDVPKWLVECGVKVAFASDLLGTFDDGQLSRRYELHWRAVMYESNFEVLRQATSVAAELLALSGPRNPYPGKLGVIEEGALADLLVVDGNPLDDMTVLGASDVWTGAPAPEPIESIRLIMKDGLSYKNTL